MRFDWKESLCPCCSSNENDKYTQTRWASCILIQNPNNQMLLMSALLNLAAAIWSSMNSIFPGIVLGCDSHFLRKCCSHLYLTQRLVRRPVENLWCRCLPNSLQICTSSGVDMHYNERYFCCNKWLHWRRFVQDGILSVSNAVNTCLRFLASISSLQAWDLK